MSLSSSSLELAGLALVRIRVVGVWYRVMGVDWGLVDELEGELPLMEMFELVFMWPRKASQLEVGERVFSLGEFKSMGRPSKSQETPCLEQLPQIGWTSSHLILRILHLCGLTCVRGVRGGVCGGTSRILVAKGGRKKYVLDLLDNQLWTFCDFDGVLKPT